VCGRPYWHVLGGEVEQQVRRGRLRDKLHVGEQFIQAVGDAGKLGDQVTPRLLDRIGTGEQPPRRLSKSAVRAGASSPEKNSTRRPPSAAGSPASRWGCR
jgi:hypothetical protein